MTFISTPCYASVLFNSADTVVTGTTMSDDVMTENGAFTFSAWINPTTLGENVQGQLINREAVGTPGVGIRLNASNTLRFFCFAGASTLARNSANNFITLGTWQHIALTWTGANDPTTIHMYNNGVESTSYAGDSTGTSPADNSAQTFKIGNIADTSQSFNGQITEVAIWNKVLSVDEINILASSRVKGTPLQISTDNLKGYFPLGDCQDRQTCIGSILERIRNNNGTPSTNCSGMAEEILSYQ